MLELSDLQNLVNAQGRSNYDRTLLCLALTPMQERTNSDICGIGKQAGWSSVTSSTVATSLKRAKGLAIKTLKGWKLTDDGEARVRTLAGTRVIHKVPVAAVKLRAHAAKLSNPDTRAFVEEAVRCFEHGLFRSAVVMSWVGAVHLLYAHVVAKRLADFNAEATKRTVGSKYPWKPATTTDDLALMKESDFLDVLQAISILGKNVKLALKSCLDRRNSCGHPNSYKLAEAVVAAHVEELLLNVYDQYS